jgi:hypothetical protein
VRWAIRQQWNQPQQIDKWPTIQGRYFLIDVLWRQIEKALPDLPIHYQRQREAHQKPLDEEGSHSGSFL